MKEPETADKDLQENLINRAKKAAAEITSVLNELISTNNVEKAPSML